MITAPVLGDGTIPIPVRALLAVVLSFLMLPLTSKGAMPDAFSLAGVLAMFEQAVIGAVIGLALQFGGAGLAGQDCTKRTLDLSGDGTNNDGISPEVARRELAMPGITVNGLVIGANVETLGRYYQRFVIQGPGAFVEVAACQVCVDSINMTELLAAPSEQQARLIQVADDILTLAQHEVEILV